MYWRAEGTCLMCHLHSLVKEHTKTLEVGYPTAAMHTTHEYTAQRLKEW